MYRNRLLKITALIKAAPKIMSKQVPWNKIILEEFISLAVLTDEEEKIIRTRVKGWTITKQAMTFGMSPAAVNRIIRRLKIKYDNVQPYSPLLPPRRHSAVETYMDTH